MIGYLSGKVLECHPDRALIDVSGVGYEVQIPLGTYYSLATGAGKPVSLYIHTHVREDSLQLFGFARFEERVAFEQLIGISGVGPKLALTILSIGPDELREAIVDQDRGRLQKIPGVGKKTAERVILELKDKMIAAAASAARTPSVAPTRGATSSTLHDDALSALVNLGYPREVADRAVNQARKSLGGDATLEVVLRGALGGLVH